MRPRPKHRELLDLCARVMRNPERVLQVSRLRIGRGFLLEPHSHASILQLDIAVGCGGAWIFKGRRIAPQTVSAIAFYPRQKHGYELTAKRVDAEIYSFKLEVAPDWPALRTRIFPSFCAKVPGEAPLLHVFRRLARLSTLNKLHTPLAAVSVCEILCHWPAHEQRGARPAVANINVDDERLEPALDVIESRLAQPPDLAELAYAAHLSPRHFARRFRAFYGCSPHAYVTARRVERAGELLTQGTLTVTDVAAALAFPSIHTFSRWFHHETGITPTQCRQKPLVL